MNKQPFFLLCLLGIGTGLQAQDSSITQPVNPPAVENAVAVYYSSVDHQSRLYNGIEHIGYSPRIKGHAYFQEVEMQKSTIVYDGLVYTDVPMWYDMMKEQVIIQHFNKFTRIGLVSQKVTAFTLLNHHFIRLDIDSTLGLPISTGFYDQLYKGPSTVLVRRVKTIYEVVKDEVEREFTQQNYYFIQKDSTYYSVKNYKGLLSIYKGRSKEIKQYLRKNKIRYRKDKENAIVKVAAYYDSLNR
jgi:hypothetical protein